MIQGFIFDFDNTIYDYDKCNNHGLSQTFKYIHNKYNFEEEFLKKTYEEINLKIKEDNNYSNKFNKSIYFKKLIENIKINLTELDILLNVYNNEFNNCLVVYDDIIKLFELLKGKKIKIAILSNNIFKQQYDKLVYLNLIKYIDVIQTSDEIGCEKPNKLIYLAIINKMGLCPENIAMVGDNFMHDIAPALELNLIPFHFTNNVDVEIKIKEKYFEFGKYNQIIDTLTNYFDSVDELIYLSKLFGQSTLNIQGQGGNISVKTLGNNLILVKSSGTILGNMDEKNGFCIANNKKCNDMLLENNSGELLNTKIFGYKNPSMETFFHCFMKKYTVHIHFTLSNLFLCCNETDYFDKFDMPHKIIDYYPPGIDLAKEIYKKYDDDTNIYFLKNHGLILTSNSIAKIEKLYLKIFSVFDHLNLYGEDINCFIINKTIYEKFKISIICRKYNVENINNILKIKYCFPDLAVYVQEIVIINNFEDISISKKCPDLIIYNKSVYILAENISKLYSVIETLDKYIMLCEKYNKLTVIDNFYIQNMEQEKYRKNI
jgi:HAD superfamily hydrolase (TIGR01549 family)